MRTFFKTLSVLIVTSGVSLSHPVLAAGGKDVKDDIHLNMSDKAALQNGAKLFVNYCLSCHSAQYSRFNRVARDLDIPEDLLKQNLMFTTEKTGDLMTTTMPADDAQEWFGVTPPDLSLVTRVRKPDWVYTYLRAFYRDEKSPSGWNNSLFENVAMPHALYELQGVQRLVGKLSAEEMDARKQTHGTQNEDDAHTVVGNAEFELVHPGKLSPAEFDKAMSDLTAFLVYLAEPAQLQRKSIGVYTLFFLIILLLLCYALKQEYWRDIH